LRMGVSEMTRFGMEEADFTKVAHLVGEVVKGGKSVKEEITKLRSGFLQMRFCFEEKDLGPYKERLLGSF